MLKRWFTCRCDCQLNSVYGSLSEHLATCTCTYTVHHCHQIYLIQVSKENKELVVKCKWLEEQKQCLETDKQETFGEHCLLLFVLVLVHIHLLYCVTVDSVSIQLYTCTMSCSWFVYCSQSVWNTCSTLYMYVCIVTVVYVSKLTC